MRFWLISQWLFWGSCNNWYSKNHMDSINVFILTITCPLMAFIIRLCSCIIGKKSHLHTNKTLPTFVDMAQNMTLLAYYRIIYSKDWYQIISRFAQVLIIEITGIARWKRGTPHPTKNSRKFEPQKASIVVPQVLEKKLTNQQFCDTKKRKIFNRALHYKY